MAKRIDITGKRYGMLTALHMHPNSIWGCICDCGNKVNASYQNLKNGNTKSCGCYRSRRMHSLRTQFTSNDLTGQRYGRLIAVRPAEKTVFGTHTKWHCVCDCGNTVVVSSAHLRNGNTKSCKCLRRELRSAKMMTHGETSSIRGQMINGVRKRAKEKGLDFNIEITDIIVPDVCPLLNIPMFKDGLKLGPNSPTVDRIDSSLGYVKGNIWVISHRANMIKNAATFDEFNLIRKNWMNELARRGAYSSFD